MNFPEAAHIELIRQALWSPREFGRAAVMVGSGFSRNADPITRFARPLPLWADLTQILVEKLGIAKKGTDAFVKATLKSEETSRALRLADEFEAAFGRAKLDELLMEIVVDSDHNPGDLHSLLCDLPWSDIFTTNYDTLIERAAAPLVERRYDVVRSVDDIPIAMRPRIVKLHGSFPASRPFIFTEEDFRNYPRRAAGFVNLVQQSMMENVFCLLGFGGDDPNFLHWSGWVRDHLGASSPRIYLCGLFDLTGSQKSLLEKRNVTLVDLSQLFPSFLFPDVSQRHRLALEWFLVSLANGRPPAKDAWPRPMKTNPTKPEFGRLPPLPSPFTQPQIEPTPDE